MPTSQAMCKQCATFARNKSSSAWQHAHLRDIVAVRIAQLVHVSCTLKWHVVARHSAELCVTVLRASVRVALCVIKMNNSPPPPISYYTVHNVITKKMV